MPDGVCLLDADLVVQWANRRFREMWRNDSPVGSDFFSVLQHPQFFNSVSPFECLRDDADEGSSAATATLQCADDRFFDLHTARLQSNSLGSFYVVTLSESTGEVRQQQKMAAIHQAGSKLTDLKPEEILAMDVEQRIDYLKDNIRHYTRNLLNFEVIEIRLLERSSGQLIPLLSVGIDQSAADRRLLARPQANGVTGWVAACGESYLCPDTVSDPIYIEGFKGARSSLTVPLILHDQVIGTINVESPKVRAFNLSDQQFLEIFARDVSVALNTLELLVAQKTNAAHQSCEAIHAAVSTPIDEILVDATSVIENTAGSDVDQVARARRILRNTRTIKQAIHRVRQSVAPMEAIVGQVDYKRLERLRGKRILVVDADPTIRADAHALLEPYGCLIEAAGCGDEAVAMVRNCEQGEGYDLYLADIRLPDYSGYQLMVRLQQFMKHVPLILMSGYGYDPGHSIVKARQAGLHPKGLVSKPFRVDQLLLAVETIVESRPSASAG